MSSNSGIGWNAKFAESNIDTLYELIRDHPLGILITASTQSHDGDAPSLQLHSTYIPFVLDIPDHADPGTENLGISRGFGLAKRPRDRS
jgi:predicted FMN-binding regulatory protein PaiB